MPARLQTIPEQRHLQHFSRSVQSHLPRCMNDLLRCIHRLHLHPHGGPFLFGAIGIFVGQLVEDGLQRSLVVRIGLELDILRIGNLTGPSLATKWRPV